MGAEARGTLLRVCAVVSGRPRRQGPTQRTDIAPPRRRCVSQADKAMRKSFRFRRLLLFALCNKSQVPGPSVCSGRVPGALLRMPAAPPAACTRTHAAGVQGGLYFQHFEEELLHKDASLSFCFALPQPSDEGPRPGIRVAAAVHTPPTARHALLHTLLRAAQQKRKAGAPDTCCAMIFPFDALKVTELMCRLSTPLNKPLCCLLSGSCFSLRCRKT